jgi:hypothetical protein
MGLYRKVNIPTGEILYDTPGTYNWTAPANVTSVSVLTIGGGGGGSGSTSGGSGGGGGGLGWKNNIPVVPGQTYIVVVAAGGSSSSTGSNGGTSYFINTSTVAGYGGAGAAIDIGGNGGTFVGDGGGNGGNGGNRGSTSACGGGGGAAGYVGKGGNATTGNAGILAENGAGGGSGGGGGGGSADTAGSGGGTGIYGIGTEGLGGARTTSDGRGGFGGSGGTNASQASTSTSATNVYSTSNLSVPGLYGGGAGGSENGTAEMSSGGKGAVRIVWGANRNFPYYNVEFKASSETSMSDFANIKIGTNDVKSVYFSTSPLYTKKRLLKRTRTAADVSQVQYRTSTGYFYETCSWTAFYNDCSCCCTPSSPACVQDAWRTDCTYQGGGCGAFRVQTYYASINYACGWQNYSNWINTTSCTPVTPTCNQNVTRTECQTVTGCVFGNWGAWEEVSTCASFTPHCVNGAVQTECQIA